MFDNIPAYRLPVNTIDEVSHYLCTKPEDVQNEDLLRWWHDHRRQYPRLFRMALDYHSIPCEYQNFATFVLTLIFITVLQLQVLLSAWSVYSAKAASSSRTCVTVSPPNPCAHCCALEIGVHTDS